MNASLGATALLFVTVYRRSKAWRDIEVLFHEKNCLDNTKLLMRAFPGAVSVSLSTQGGTWFFRRVSRLRVPASYRKKFGKRAAREFQRELDTINGRIGA